MQLQYNIITPSAITPIQVDSVLKYHCAINGESYNELLSEYIEAATGYIESYLGYPLMSQVISLSLAALPRESQVLTGNVVSLTKLEYTDLNYEPVEITEAEDLPTLERKGLLSYAKLDWPKGSDFKIEATAGYTVENVPPAIKQVARLLVAHMFEMRMPTVVRLPDTVTTRLDFYALY